MVDYQQAPLLVIWEVTRACALACVHCRASAVDVRDPRELSLDEGKRLIDEVAQMGTPLMVLTGGDPLQRTDLEDLIRHGKQAGLVMATIPAATPRLTQERVLSLRDAGVDQLALSLDGETAAKHDSFRQVEGTFDKVLQAAAWIRDAGVPLQINTVFGSWNFQDFSKLAQTVTDLGAIFWEIFFLVPTGRGSELTSCTPEQYEKLFEQIHELSLTAPFTVKVTEGQHYRRWFAQHDDVEKRSAFHHHQRLVAPRPVNSGNGFAFVDHTGEVCPSGFLPLTCGNVRDVPLSQVYRTHPTFRQLRDLSLLQGKCGVCDFRDFCSGGSRARAYGVTGNFLASEPFCAYEPPRS
ncbi:MAG: TIGR04053 family radical SAM/SPASM domain-containing protein [Spirochaetales bacterium]|nr:TIGR04053 family radical SAM/SPASM domain-containing protein [Spirochaetales bacterium]